MVYGNLSFFCRGKMIEKRDRSLTDSILMRCKNHSPKPEAIIPLYFDSSIDVRLISAAPSCKVYQSMITLQYREDLPFSFDFSSSLLGIPKYMSSSLFLPNYVSPPMSVCSLVMCNLVHMFFCLACFCCFTGSLYPVVI